MPPARAIAIAVSASVTVSIAALTNGTLICIDRLKRDFTDASSGMKSAYFVQNETSSKVSPSSAYFDINSWIGVEREESTGNGLATAVSGWGLEKRSVVQA
jgi:hypothetical protein